MWAKGLLAALVLVFAGSAARAPYSASPVFGSKDSIAVKAYVAGAGTATHGELGVIVRAY